jgi:replicative DNA helicase
LDGDKTQRSKVYEVESITRGLKALAKELSIPVVLICQLNRECERRDNKRPMLSDLRDSGALEQDADLVLFFYNDSKYNEDSPDKGIIECEIAKQRNGPTSRIKLAWIESYTRFDNLINTTE